MNIKGVILEYAYHWSGGQSVCWWKFVSQTPSTVSTSHVISLDKAGFYLSQSVITLVLFKVASFYLTIHSFSSCVCQKSYPNQSCPKCCIYFWNLLYWQWLVQLSYIVPHYNLSMYHWPSHNQSGHPTLYQHRLWHHVVKIWNQSGTQGFEHTV